MSPSMPGTAFKTTTSADAGIPDAAVAVKLFPPFELT
jgi:hypothetical protein